MEKPTLILVAAGIQPGAGSEPSKGWGWAHALTPFYRLEILTLPHDAALLARTALPADWRVHAVGEDFAPGPARQYYPAYQRWCHAATHHCRTLIDRQPIAGLHHITLGSFRVMGRYDTLGIPYTLGPLGGGESIPWTLLPRLRLPGREIAAEALRPLANYAFALLPGLRATFRGASLTLATTRESLAVVRAMGARRGAALFPDALDLAGDDPETVLAGRARQAAALPGGRLRCVCAGRALWWKGMHLAIDFIARLRQGGIDATLDLYTRGKALAAWQARAGALGISEHVAFHDMIGRDDLMARYRDFHLFLNPTMHDSSSPALVEAYFTGLPSMTLGLAGAVHVVTPQTGLNDRVDTVEQWLDAGQRMAAGWMADPQRWLAACRAAKARAHEFDQRHLERCVREHLVPIFGGEAVAA